MACKHDSYGYKCPECASERAERHPDVVHEEIANMSPEERGDLIRRIKGYNWTDAKKESAITFILFLGLIGETMPKDGKRRPSN